MAEDNPYGELSLMPWTRVLPFSRQCMSERALMNSEDWWRLRCSMNGREKTMLKRIVFCIALVTFTFGMVLSINAQTQPSPVQPSPVKRTILQRSDVPGTNLEI